MKEHLSRPNSGSENRGVPLEAAESEQRQWEQVVQRFALENELTTSTLQIAEQLACKPKWRILQALVKKHAPHYKNPLEDLGQNQILALLKQLTAPITDKRTRALDFSEYTAEDFVVTSRSGERIDPSLAHNPSLANAVLGDPRRYTDSEKILPLPFLNYSIANR